MMHRLTTSSKLPELTGPIITYKRGRPLLWAMILLTVLASVLLFEGTRPQVVAPLTATLLPNKDYFLVHFQKAIVLVGKKKVAAYAITYRERQPNGWAIGSMVVVKTAIHRSDELSKNQLVITQMINGKPSSVAWNPSHYKKDASDPPEMVL